MPDQHTTDIEAVKAEYIHIVGCECRPLPEIDAIDWRQHDDLCGLLTGFTTECDCSEPLPDDEGEHTPEIEYVDLRHDCETPSVEHLPNYGEDHQVMARWRCPACGSRWAYAASWLRYNRMYWTQVGRPSRKWRKAEARRLRRLVTTPGGQSS